MPIWNGSLLSETNTLPELPTKLLLLFKIGLNKCDIETPGAYGRGEFSIALLLTFYMVNSKVLPKIGEYICNDDRS